MGFKAPGTILKLRYEEEDMNGLVVRARTMPIKRYLELMRLKAQVVDEDAALDEFERLFTEFAKCLIEWNLEDEDGQPVPTTSEGVLDQDPRFMLRVITPWLEAIGTVPAPLKPSSDSGPQYPEVSMPMEPLSADLPS